MARDAKPLFCRELPLDFIHHDPPEATRTRVHPHHPRGGGRVQEPRHALLGRQGLRGHGPPGPEGLPPGEVPLSAAARRYGLQVSRDVRVPRQVRERDRRAADRGPQRGVDRQGRPPRQSGHRQVLPQLKTRALLDHLAKHRFDAAFGGARRDEEKSRAKERVFSFRDEFGQWDPKNQRPELWNLYNANIDDGECVRVFPLSNWTELDVWQYIQLEEIPVVPIYFVGHAEPSRSTASSFRVNTGEPWTPGEARVGEDDVKEVAAVSARSAATRAPARCGRGRHHRRDHRGDDRRAPQRAREPRDRSDQDGSMEQKKREGYF